MIKETNLEKNNPSDEERADKLRDKYDKPQEESIKYKDKESTREVESRCCC